MITILRTESVTGESMRLGGATLGSEESRALLGVHFAHRGEM